MPVRWLRYITETVRPFSFITLILEDYTTDISSDGYLFRVHACIVPIDVQVKQMLCSSLEYLTIIGKWESICQLPRHGGRILEASHLKSGLVITKRMRRDTYKCTR